MRHPRAITLNNILSSNLRLQPQLPARAPPLLLPRRVLPVRKTENRWSNQGCLFSDGVRIKALLCEDVDPPFLDYIGRDFFNVWEWLDTCVRIS